MLLDLRPTTPFFFLGPAGTLKMGSPFALGPGEQEQSSALGQHEDRAPGVLLDLEINNSSLCYSKLESGQKSHSESLELKTNNSVLC